MPDFTIQADDLISPEIAGLLSDHLGEMNLHSPPESVHALDLEKLKRPEITFWSIWNGGELVGCGALKELDKEHAEIKSMRTDPKYRGQGAGKLMLRHILEVAKQRGYTRLNLETGPPSNLPADSTPRTDSPIAAPLPTTSPTPTASL